MAGWGAALQSIGGDMMSYGMGRLQDSAADERWKERETLRSGYEQKAWEARQKWLQENSPPQQRTIETTAPGGAKVKQTQEWTPSGDQSQGPPAPARWSTVAEVKENKYNPINIAGTDSAGNPTVTTALYDPNNPDDVKELGTGKRYAPRPVQGNASNRAGKLVRQVDKEGNVAYGTVEGGVFHPVMDEKGEPLTGQAWRPRHPTGTGPNKNADASGPGHRDFDPQFIDGGYAQAKPPLGQLDSAPQKSAAPAGSAENPIPVGPGSPKPPSGTWIRTPDGRVKQVP